MGFVSPARRGQNGSRPKHAVKALFAAAALTAAAFQVGCTAEQANTGTNIVFDYLNLRNSFLDPSQVGRFDMAQPFGEARFVQLPILEQLNIVDETVDHWVNATEPTQADLAVETKEYTFAVGDAIGVSIYELINPGATYERSAQITETGAINIQLLGNINVIGLTPSQLEEKIRQLTIEKGILPPPGPGVAGPQVTVTLQASRQRMFSILGAVGQAGSYQIIANDFRLLDALAMARDVPVQPGMDYLYVIRQVPAGEKPAAPAVNKPDNGSAKPANPLEMIDDIKKTTTTPGAPTAPAAPAVPATDSAPATKSGVMLPRENPDLKFKGELPADLKLAAEMAAKQPIHMDLMDEANATSSAPAKTGAPVAAATTSAPATTTAAPGTTAVPTTNEFDAAMSQPDNSQYVFVDGKLVVLPNKPTTTPSTPIAVTPAPSMPTTDSGEPIQTQRIIRIPLGALREGISRYNIVVRPGDVINIPGTDPGEFYLMGQINRPGVYTLTGRNVTLKQAVAAAGNLSGLAIPRRAEIIRRVGKNQEVTVQVNLQAIFNGQQPDLFIKPNDILNVGTDMVAPFLAVTRNAYRASYGWGYVYDKNVGDTTNNR